ncbi:MAG: hypothetical protein ACYCOU_20280 [Sulfobacillus sp.]
MPATVPVRQKDRVPERYKAGQHAFSGRLHNRRMDRGKKAIYQLIKLFWLHMGHPSVSVRLYTN